MNDPNTKYGVNDERLLFFNYHEYLTKDYTLIDDTHPPGLPSQSTVSPHIERLIVVNHFINPHVPIDSVRFNTTRIIRIPRCFDTINYPDLIPQFSNIFPGKEPAAIKSANNDTNDGDHFKPLGIFDDTVFGDSSITPLFQYITYEEFKTIIDKVNLYLYQAYNPLGINGLESIIDILTGTLYSKITTWFGGNYCKRQLQLMEEYILLVNENHAIKFISPQRTGFTSLMNGIFAIEKPSGITSSKFIGDLQHIFTNSKTFEPDLLAAKNKIIKDLSTDKSWSSKKIEKRANLVKVKIGHGGTLDPLASGVLVIGIGQGTKKLAYYLGECTKTYETKALLGISTTTGDSEGEILCKNNIDHITKDQVNGVVERFIGDLKQTPPIFLALKMNGKPLYDYAREGKPLPFPIKSRDVKVNHISVSQHDLLTTDHEFTKLESQLDEHGVPKEHSLINNPTLNDSPLFFSSQFLAKCQQDNTLNEHVGKPRVLQGELPDKLPLIHMTCEVSSGTYIRSLISDIGRSLESSAYMVELKRTKQSNWEIGKNVFKYQDFQSDEKIWGKVLKEVLDTGDDVVLSEIFKKYQDLGTETEINQAKEDGKLEESVQLQDNHEPSETKLEQSEDKNLKRSIDQVE